MNKIMFLLIALLLLTIPSLADDKETVVLREWNNSKSIEYLEYNKKNSFGDLRSYIIKSVYGELQDRENDGGYNISINKYLMNCAHNLFILQKNYLFNDDDLVQYKKYDETYYKDDPSFGWKSVDTDKVQKKIREIFCK